MKRRAFMGSLGLGAVSTGGCLTSESPGGTSLTPQDTSSEVETEAGDCPPPTTETFTVRENTPEPSGTGDVAGGLAINSHFDGELTVVLIRLPQKESGERKVVVVKTYTDSKPYISLGDQMQDQFSYEAVIRSGCDQLWKKEIYSYAAYEIRIESNGSVKITSVVES